MKARKNWQFTDFYDLQDKWNNGWFDCNDIADFNEPIWLDWCARLDDWAPKVALCFNHYTSAVTLDRISQHEMPELRRLVCYHPNCSVETLQRLTNDFDKITVESAVEQLEKATAPRRKTPARRRPTRKTSSRRAYARKR